MSFPLPPVDKFAISSKLKAGWINSESLRAVLEYFSSP